MRLLPAIFCALLCALRPTAAQSPIQHIIVIMQENRTFDHYFGRLARPEHYGAFHIVDNPNGVTGIPGVEINRTVPDFFMLNPDHQIYTALHARLLGLRGRSHSWRSMHAYWNNGQNNAFSRSRVCYYDETDLPFYYGLADAFVISDQHYASVLGPTYPNRFYLFCGTSFGNTDNHRAARGGWAQKTIFDLCDEHSVSWAYYCGKKHNYLRFFQTSNTAGTRLRSLDMFNSDLQADTLPQVTFVESVNDEHTPANPQLGQREVAARVGKLFASNAWNSSVFILTYDEGGGFYDHIPPPATVAPDDIAPDTLHCGFQFDRLGFRVPLVVVSPFVRRHRVSHAITDHTSILALIETTFGLPPLTARDAVSGNFSDLFDFTHPDFTVPTLPSAIITAP